MTTVRCPVCQETMDGDKYDHHMAWKHPDFQKDWFPGIVLDVGGANEIKPKIQKKLSGESEEK